MLRLHFPNEPRQLRSVLYHRWANYFNFGIRFRREFNDPQWYKLNFYSYSNLVMMMALKYLGYISHLPTLINRGPDNQFSHFSGLPHWHHFAELGSQDYLHPALLLGNGGKESPRLHASLLRIQVDVRIRSQDLYTHVNYPTCSLIQQISNEFLRGKETRPQERAEMYQACSFFPLIKFNSNPPAGFQMIWVLHLRSHMFAPAIQQTVGRHLLGMSCSFGSSIVYNEDLICQQIVLALPLSLILGSDPFSSSMASDLGQSHKPQPSYWSLCMRETVSTGLTFRLRLPKREDLLLMWTARSHGLLGGKGGKGWR